MEKLLFGRALPDNSFFAFFALALFCLARYKDMVYNAFTDISNDKS